MIILLYKLKEKIFSSNKLIQEKILEQNEDQEEMEINEETLKSNHVYIIKDEFNNENKRKKFLSIFFIGILYSISYVFFYYANLITNTSFYGNISMITEILYFSLFNKLIFGNKIYSHHLFAMIIIAISILGLYIVLIIQFIESNEWQFWRDIFFPTLFNFVVYLIFCYHLIQAKYYIEKFFIFPYELIIYLGSIGLILLFIFEPITFYISCDNDEFCSDGHIAGIISGFKQLNDLRTILLSLIVFFGLFLTAFGLWFTVKHLSPSHFLTTDSIITFLLNIMVDCYNEEIVLLKNPLFYILSILTIFGCLIYNEIIIINTRVFKYNTRQEIIKRQKIEEKKNYIHHQQTKESEDMEMISLNSSINECS